MAATAEWPPGLMTLAKPEEVKMTMTPSIKQVLMNETQEVQDDVDAH